MNEAKISCKQQSNRLFLNRSKGIIQMELIEFKNKATIFIPS